MNITNDFKTMTYEDIDGIVKEICVGCGNKTKVYFDSNIRHRKYYIYGVGQLCDECGKKKIH